MNVTGMIYALSATATIYDANNTSNSGTSLMDWIKYIVIAIIAVSTVIPGIIKMANNSGDRDDVEFNRGLRQVIIGVILGVAVIPIFSYVEDKMNSAGSAKLNVEQHQTSDVLADNNTFDFNGETYVIE